MSSHSSVAASVRRRKEAHPELYCVDVRCLWRLSRLCGSDQGGGRARWRLGAASARRGRTRQLAL